MCFFQTCEGVICVFVKIERRHTLELLNRYWNPQAESAFLFVIEALVLWFKIKRTFLPSNLSCFVNLASLLCDYGGTGQGITLWFINWIDSELWANVMHNSSSELVAMGRCQAISSSLICSNTVGAESTASFKIWDLVGCIVNGIATTRSLFDLINRVTTLLIPSK